MLQDTRYALRMMRRSPLFSTAVIVAIASAIAVNTTIFSVVNAVLLRPVPLSTRTASCRSRRRTIGSIPRRSAPRCPTSSRGAKRLDSFEEFAAIGFGNYTLTGNGEPEQLSGNRISPAVMRVLGLAPVVGRAFVDTEEKPTAPVAMIGEGLGKRRFGADRSVVGHTITLNDVPTTVVGVAPAALNLLSGGDVYTPMTIDLSNDLRLNHLAFVVGRVKRGVSLGQAQADMDSRDE
jgi:putative ABC transport system permease protein